LIEHLAGALEMQRDIATRGAFHLWRGHNPKACAIGQAILEPRRVRA